MWSLGVILVNLVCGRNPWRCASPTDESFAAFLQDPSFLRRILPISHDCLDILTQIFTLDPEQRISLDRLRELVLDIDSFTEDAHSKTRRAHTHGHTRVHAPVPVVTPIPVSAAHVDAPYYDSPSPDAEPVFTFDDPELYTPEADLPALRADTGSPLAQRSSSGSSEGPFPPTPRLGSSGHTASRVASVSSLTAPVFEAFGHRGKGPRAISPIPFATPAMFV